jgi:cardiolipin synthase
MEYPSNLQEVIYTDANSYFDGIINAINQAEKSIDLEVYLFDNDDLSHRVIEALTNAVQRKLKVRLLTDGIGACIDFYAIANQLIKAGAEVKIFHPLPWHIKQWRLSITKIKGLEKLLHLFTSINKRDHRKLIIIDQRSVWLGSFNISQKHLPKENKGENWRDTAIEIKGMDLESMQIAFDSCWHKWSKKQTVLLLPKTPFMFNFTRALRIKQRKRLLKRIQNANETIWITNAYFVPDKKLLEALTFASYRGVDVRILLSRTSDIFFIPWASAYFYFRLLNSGIHIFEFQHRMLHAKTLIIDDWASIGSSNLNRRSLHHDLELDYSLQLAKSKEKLSASFEADLLESEELDLKIFNQTRIWQRVLGGLLVFLLARWV